MSFSSNSSSLFGSSTSSGAGTGTTLGGGGGMFGGGSAASSSQPSGGLFGGTGTTGTTLGSGGGGGGLFGSASTAQPSTSGGLFGSASTAQPSTSSGGLFGGTGTTLGGGGGGMFGSASTAQPSTTSGGGLFGSASTAQPSTSGGLFGAQQSSSSGGMFGSASTAQPSTSGGLFGSASTAQPSTSGGLFGSSSVAQPSTSGGGLFGSSQPTSSSGGLFGAQPQQQQQQSSGGLFGSSQPSSGGLFGGTGTDQNEQPLIWQQFTNGEWYASNGDGCYYQPNYGWRQFDPKTSERTTFRELSDSLKTGCTNLQKIIIQNNTMMKEFSSYNDKLEKLPKLIDQIYNKLDTLSMSIDYTVQSFENVREAIQAPTYSITEQFHQISVGYKSPYPQPQPSREMEKIVDDFDRRIERLYQSVQCIAPSAAKKQQLLLTSGGGNGTNISNTNFQDTFVSTLQSNQNILRNEAVTLDHLVSDLENRKRTYLTFKKRYYKDYSDPFPKRGLELQKSLEDYKDQSSVYGGYLVKDH
eukprot:gene13651-16075_t